MTRTRFKFEDLLDCCKFYLPYRDRIRNAQMDYLEVKNGWNYNLYYNDDSSIAEVEAKGVEWMAYYLINGNEDVYINIFCSVDCLNRAFVKLLDMGEVTVAHTLIRLQLDNLTYIFAEILYPFNVLYKVCEKGRTLNQIKIDGVPLNPTEIRKQIDERFNTNISKLYKKYSCFVHPSTTQTLTYWGEMGNPNKRIKSTDELKQKEYVKDMVEINNLLTEMLKAQISSLKEKTNEINNNRKSELPTS